MILVVASAVDRAAAEFVRRAGGGARLLTPASLSLPGWRLSVPEREPPIMVVDGSRVPAAEISAVVIRLPHVSETELPHIAAADRSYAAAEMQAFLYALLSSLRCPVVNRPTPVCLAGRNWRLAQWAQAAREVGFTTAGDLSHAPRAVSVAGGECFGASNPVLREAAVRLAAKAGVQLLRLWCGGGGSAPCFLGADLWPDISDPQIGAALTALVCGEVPV